MGEEKSNVSVVVKWDGKEFSFSGTADEVIRSILKFLSDVYPAFELVKRLIFTVDVAELLKQSEGVFALSPEGYIILVARGSLTDKEAIGLHLVKQYLTFLFKKSDKASLSDKEIASVIGKSDDIVHARAKELIDQWLVERVDKGEYKITPAGVRWFMQNIVPKIKPSGK